MAYIHLLHVRRAKHISVTYCVEPQIRWFEGKKSCNLVLRQQAPADSEHRIKGYAKCFYLIAIAMETQKTRGYGG